MDKTQELDKSIKSAVYSFLYKGYFIAGWGEEDYIQHIHLKAIESNLVKKYDPSKASFSHFVFQFAKNKMIDLSRYKTSDLTDSFDVHPHLLTVLPDTRQNPDTHNTRIVLEQVKEYLQDRVFINGITLKDLFNTLIIDDIPVRQFASENNISRSSAYNLKGKLVEAVEDLPQRLFRNLI